MSGEQKEPWELLAFFFHGMLKFLGVVDVVRNIRCFTVTTETLDDVQVDNLQKACRKLGLADDRFVLMDHEESFYYYVMTQKLETWNRSVGWYCFNGNEVTFRKMSMNSAVKPVLVTLAEPVKTKLREEPGERDEDFCGFIKETLGKDLYSSIQMNGEGFDQEWAQKSVKILCYQRRKVFYGNNLFAAGACAAGAERFIRHSLKEYRYISNAVVLTNIGMDMRVMGAPAYCPMIEAGANWYECRAYCELILDQTEELVFVVQKVGEEEKKRISMALPGLPKRPERTTRLSVKLQYISREQCQITVRDLGFGEMFPSTGKVWTETTGW